MNLRSGKVTFFLLLIFTLSGGALRLIHIGVPSMWVDEANTVFSAESIVRSGLPVMPTGIVYGRAPLYTYSVAFMLRHSGGPSLETARITAALFGILVIPLTFFIASLLFGRRTGIISAFFMTFCAFEIGWSRVARMYTLLQFMTLLGVLFFVLGFERQSVRKRPGFDRLQRSRSVSGSFSGAMDGVDIIALFIFTLIMAAAYFWVHLLTIFTVLGLILYLFTCAVYHIIHDESRKRWLNKYCIFSAIISVGCIAVCFLPQTVKMWNHFLSYTPPWAFKGSSAHETWNLFYFIFSWYRFPLGILFVWGALQILIRNHRSGWMATLLFLTPLLALTLIFTHRMDRYLFAVYPFFLMLAAYGVVALLDLKPPVIFSKIAGIRRFQNYCIPGLIILVFIMTPWIKIGKNIPWFEDGEPNGAVHFEEWREASDIVNRNRQDGDMIISSLPEVMLYYGVPSDWALNWNNYLFSLKRKKIDSRGRIMEIFAGRPLIGSTEKLKEIVNSNIRGWIVLSEYQYGHVIYTPDDFRQYIDQSFEFPQWKTRKSTVRIYHWDHTKEPMHEL